MSSSYLLVAKGHKLLMSSSYLQVAVMMLLDQM